MYHDYYMMGTSQYPTKTKTSSVGSSIPFSIMPPFIELRLCMKIVDDTISESRIADIEKRLN
jgi:hypothetical protein